MKHWSFLITSLFAAALLSLIAPPVQAIGYKHLNSCDWREYGHWVELEVDYLYWKPCIDNMDLAAIVTQENGDRKVKYKDLCSDWEGGLRVSFLLPDLFYGWDFSISYYRINYEQSKDQEFSNRDESNGIITPLAFKADPFIDTWQEGEESLDLFYHEWDLLLTYDICCIGCHCLNSFFGIAALFLDQEIEGDFSREEEMFSKELEIEWKSDYCGIGIRMGSGYQYHFSDCLMFFTKAHVTLLIGEAVTTNFQSVIETSQSDRSITISEDNSCHPVPGYHIAAGLTYLSCICELDYAIRIGYEYVNWHNLSNQRVFSGDNLNTQSGHSSSPRTRTLGFHGLFAGVAMSF